MAWVKMHRFDAFSRNVNYINLKVFTHGGIYKLKKIQQALKSLQRVYRNIKICILEHVCISWRTRVVNSTGYHFVDSNLRVDIWDWECWSWKRGNIRKREWWNRKFRHLSTLCAEVSRKFRLRFYTYVLGKVSQNGATFIQKLPPGFKNYMRNLNNFRQAVKNPKSWNSMGYFCPKLAFLQLKTLYTEDLSNMTFNYLRENSSNFLCHLWNHKSFFATQLLCVFLARTLHTFYKSSPWKCKFSGFRLLALQSAKFLISFFKLKVSLSSKVGLLFRVIRDNSSVLF